MSSEFLSILLSWLIALAFFFSFMVLLRYLQHRERMAMISYGLNPRLLEKQRRSRGILRAGLIITMVGLALIGFILPPSFNAIPLHFGPWLLPGLIPLAVGIALTASYYLERDTLTGFDEDKNRQNDLNGKDENPPSGE